MATFDWSGYLRVAQVLSRTKDEAFERAAISRAYYAAFCAARNELIRLGYWVPSDESHRWVWEQFRHNFTGDYVELGRKGNRLRQLRRQADYDDEYQDNLSLSVAFALVAAREILDALGAQNR